MMRGRHAATLVGLMALCLGLASLPATAAGGAVYGNGVFSSEKVSAEFWAYGDGASDAYFGYWDYGEGRAFELYTSDLECLGDRLGGQAIRLEGKGTDTSAESPVDIQVFLVDRAEGKPDRMSLKVKRRNGSVTYFVPLRDVDAGEVWVGC